MDPITAIILSCMLMGCDSGGVSPTAGIESPASLNDGATPGSFPTVDPGPSPVPAGAAGAAGATINVLLGSTSPLDQARIPLTFGQVFVLGTLLPGNGLTGQLSDGSTVPIQIDSKATHPDGSIRHAVLSAVVPALAANQSLTLQLAKSAGPSSTGGADPSALLNSGFSASVTVNANGIVYSASADSLLRSGSYLTWMSGSIASEWIVSAPLRTQSGTPHPQLAARFAIRFYPAVNKAKVDVTVENDWAYEPGPLNVTYDVQVLVGGKTVYSKARLTHYHHARWRKEFWWGGEPLVHVAQSASYLITTKAVPRYDPSLRISSTALGELSSGWTGARTELMGTGQANPSMPDTGGRPDIGLLPAWTVMYLLSGDKDAKDITLRTADLAGSWSIHYRDKRTDRPISIVDYPYMTLLGKDTDTLNPGTGKYESFPVCGGDCTSPNDADSSHQPAFSFVPYMLTGDYYHLEELQFWAMYNLFQHNPGYREDAKGLVKADQVRGQAWSMRTLGEAAWITPDSDPLKRQFETFLSNNLDWYNANYPASNTANSLGVIINGVAVEYNNDLGIAPWQDDFFTSAIGRLNELGYVKARQLLLWKAKFPVARMTDTGYCWIYGSNYSVNIRDSASAPFYGSIAQVYQASVPSSQTGLPCGSPAMAASLDLQTGEMVGYSSSNVGYPSNMQPALAYSVDAGAVGAGTAWQVFMKRSVKPDYSDGPQFAIVPR